ncbi:MAG TPA: hypothetical protein DER09_15205 [Prolixibacteraceae bacterium]|nr:hypothetical protein [Prolixibacteraceae bacterium]
MKINRNNYESFFIDYLEGNLDEKLVDDFIEFLTQNPDLKEELAMFSPVAIEPANLEFNKKELLYKEKFDLENEFTDAAIATLEGDLNDDEKVAFETYIATHPEKKHDLNLFEKTRLIADQSVVYQKKNELYKTTPLKAVLLWSGRVAAVLVLALLAYFFVGKNEKAPVENNTVAVLEDSKPKKELPVEIKKIQENNTSQQKTKPVKTSQKTLEKGAKKPKSEPKQNESLRENSKGRISHDDLAMTRIETDQFAQLSPVSATIKPELPETTLQTMYITIPQPELFEERLLVDVVKEKTGIEKINFSKITKAGLNLVTSLSNEKFSYQIDEAGKVTEINYDSRLLAFTIPTTRTTENTGE